MDRLVTTAFVVVFGRGLVQVVSRHLAYRRAAVNDVKANYSMLNSHTIFHSSLELLPDVVTSGDRLGIAPLHKQDGMFVSATPGAEKKQVLRNNHKAFCAKWARACKARFEYARVCEDTKLNRASLHRWLLSQWKELTNSIGKSPPLHTWDLFMSLTIDMAFMETDEHMVSESNRAAKKRARMEFYNERKFVSGWK